jgi:hypothetical protein
MTTILDNIAFTKTITTITRPNSVVVRQCIETYIENLRADPGDIKFEMKRVECEKLRDRIRVLEMEIRTLNGEFHQGETRTKPKKLKPKINKKNRRSKK